MMDQRVSQSAQITSHKCYVLYHIPHYYYHKSHSHVNVTHHTFNHYNNHTTRGRCARRLVAASVSVPETGSQDSENDWGFVSHIIVLAIGAARTRA